MKCMFIFFVALFGLAQAAPVVIGDRTSNSLLCEGANKIDCLKIGERSNNYDLNAIISFRTPIPAVATWLEVRDRGYFLCMFDAGASKCETLRTPYIVGTRLTLQQRKDGAHVLALKFPIVDGMPNKSQRLEIGKSFGQSIQSAQNTLAYRAAIGPKTTLASALIDVRSPKLRGVITDCFPPDDPGEDAMPKGGAGTDCDGGGGGGGDSPTWPDFPELDPGYQWGVGDGACQAACTAGYDSFSLYCGSMPVPQARALCWAAAMTAYGACLARC